MLAASARATTRKGTPVGSSFADERVRLYALHDQCVHRVSELMGRWRAVPSQGLQQQHQIVQATHLVRFEIDIMQAEAMVPFSHSRNEGRTILDAFDHGLKYTDHAARLGAQFAQQTEL